MRYEELSLPLAGGQFRLRFHPRLTVLAGLTAQDRAGLIDALAAATAGQVDGGTLVYSDPSGRRVVVRDGHARYLDDGTEVLTARLDAFDGAVEIRSLLAVNADHLGLPQTIDNPDRTRLEQELQRARRSLTSASEALDRARAVTERRREITEELEQLERDSTDQGPVDEQTLRRKGQALVELERLKAVLAALDATESQIASDDQFLDAADEVHALADEWSQAVDQLDELLVRFRDRPRLPGPQVESLSTVPDHAPPSLAAVMGAYESASARCEQLEVDLRDLEAGAGGGTSSDIRVMALGTIDQETLWMAQRRVLLATEQLEQARRAASEAGAPDFEALERVEAAESDIRAAQQKAERQWLSGMLTVSVLVCVSLLLLATGLYRLAVPPLLAIAVVAGVLLLLRPRQTVRRANQRLTAELTQAHAPDVATLRQRMAEDSPNSMAWRHADAIVDEYEQAMETWNSLVGGMSAQEVGELEDAIHEHLESYDPANRNARARVLARNLQHAQADLEQASTELRTLLGPYGLELEELPVAIGAAVHERIQQGRTARLQLELEAAEEDERKVARRLDEFLMRVGFSEGSLEARIGALGWAIDEARRRTELRAAGHDRSQLQRRLAELTAASGAAADTGSPSLPRPGSAGRARAEALRSELAALVPVDGFDLQRRHDQLSRRVASLGLELGQPSASIPLDVDERLVNTLVRERPCWPGTNADPLPALLDEPFGGAPAESLDHLLALLVEVGEATQVVLLTGSPTVVGWARAQADRGVLSLLEPTPETV